MPGIGLGLGLAFGRGRGTADVYVARKRQILGSKLRVLCLLGIDATVDGSGFVLTCPDRISGAALTRIRGGMQTVTIARESGRPCISHTGPYTEDAAFGLTTAWVPKSMLAVASCTEAVATYYNVLARGNPHNLDSTWLVRNQTTSDLYPVWGDKYVNGVAGVAMSTGIRSYESEYSANTETGVVIMAYQHVIGAAWIGNIFELRITDAVLTAGERAAEAAVTNAFWGTS